MRALHLKVHVCFVLSDENIADFGLKAAYHAYIRTKEIDGIDENIRMDGFNMTHRQLFFVAFAQVLIRSHEMACKIVYNYSINAAHFHI